MDRSNELAAVNMVEIQRNEAYGTANVEQRVSAMYEEIDITDQASGHQIDAFNTEANTAYQTQAVVMNQIVGRQTEGFFIKANESYQSSAEANGRR